MLQEVSAHLPTRMPTLPGALPEAGAVLTAGKKFMLQMGHRATGAKFHSAAAVVSRTPMLNVQEQLRAPTMTSMVCIYYDPISIPR